MRICAVPHGRSLSPVQPMTASVLPTAPGSPTPLWASPPRPSPPHLPLLLLTLVCPVPLVRLAAKAGSDCRPCMNPPPSHPAPWEPRQMPGPHKPLTPPSAPPFLLPPLSVVEPSCYHSLYCWLSHLPPFFCVCDVEHFCTLPHHLSTQDPPKTLMGLPMAGAQHQVHDTAPSPHTRPCPAAILQQEHKQCSQFQTSWSVSCTEPTCAQITSCMFGTCPWPFSSCLFFYISRLQSASS